MELHPLILAIDDDEAILRCISLDLEDQGFRVVTARTGKDGLHLARMYSPDVVLLDLMLPDMSGLDVMLGIKAAADTPVLLVTAVGRVSSRVHGLDLGADDYVPKPFNLEELEARIRAVLRRRNGGRPAERIGWAPPGVEIDLLREAVVKDGRRVPLTRGEWRLIEAFASNPGRVLSPQELIARVWGPAYSDRPVLLRMRLSRVRQKLEADPARPSILHTIKGIGYFFGPRAGIPAGAGS